MTLQERADFMWGQIARTRNVMVPWYLMLSWLYYIWDISIVPDEDYDRLCKRLLSEFDGIEHLHKNLIGLDDLQAGTAFALTHEDYPQRARIAALGLASEDKHVKWHKKYKQWVKSR